MAGRPPRIGTGRGLADAPVLGAQRQQRQARRQAKRDAVLAKLADATDAREPWERLGLSWAQELFCRERVADPDAPATVVALRVAPWAGRSRGALSNVAHNLLRRPAVQQRIAQLRREAVAAVEKRRRTKLTARRVIAELTALGLSDVRKLVTVDADGQVHVRPSAEWPDEAAAAVAAVASTPDGVRLTLHDKPAALARLAKILRLIPEPAAGIPGSGVVVGRAVIYIPDNGRDPEFAALDPPASLPAPPAEADA